MRRKLQLALVLLRLASHAFALSTPIWLTRPSCSTEAALAAAVPLQMLPPRRVEETHVDGRGRSTTGRCLPFALLLQMQRSGRTESLELPTGTSISDMDALRNRVLNFAIEQEAAPWRTNNDTYATLGDVVAAVSASRGWTPSWTPRPVAVRTWAARLRTTPRDGCDAAFLFAAAACYGMRVHVHYKTKTTGLMADTQFAAPSTAREAMQPRFDVHIGYCENERDGDGNHYVSLPALWESATPLR